MHPLYGPVEDPDEALSRLPPQPPPAASISLRRRDGRKQSLRFRLPAKPPPPTLASFARVGDVGFPPPAGEVDSERSDEDGGGEGNFATLPADGGTETREGQFAATAPPAVESVNPVDVMRPSQGNVPEIPVTVTV